MSTLLDSAAWLFCPADRPDRYERAIVAAGVVIIDLEDAIPPAAKDAARATLRTAVTQMDLSRVIVRVTPPDTAVGRADVAAARDAGVGTVMLPMVESADQVAELDGLEVVALCETAAGVLAAPDVAATPNCVALSWGVEDLSLDLGAVPRDASKNLAPAALHARTAVRYAAAAAGIPAYDTVWVDLQDTEGLDREARHAADLGYSGKLVIHPEQVAVVRKAFTPSREQLTWARRALEAHATTDSGVVVVDGQMLDRPIIERARRIIERSK